MVNLLTALMGIISIVAAIVTLLSVATDVEVVWTGRYTARGKRAYDLRYMWCKRKLYVRPEVVFVKSLMTFGFIMLFLAAYAKFENTEGGVYMATTMFLPAIRRLFGWREKLVSSETKVNVKVKYKSWFGTPKDQNGEPTGPWGCVTRRLTKRSFNTTFSINHSAAVSFGLNPMVLQIVVPKEILTLEQVATVLGEEMDALVDGESLYVTEYGSQFIFRDRETGGYIIKHPHTLPEATLGSIAERAICGSTELDLNQVLPAHPGNIVAGADNELYILLAHGGTTTWDQYCDKIGVAKDRIARNKLFIRAGKDMWARPIRVVKETEDTIEITRALNTPIRVLIHDAIKTKKGNASHDGNMFLRSGNGQPNDVTLVRGFPIDVDEQGMPAGVHTDKGFFMQKGRAITMTPKGTLLDFWGNKIEDETIGGITTVDNMKWLAPSNEWKHGDIANIYTTFSKNEEAEQKDRYKFNLLAMIIGHWTPRSLKLMEKKFKKQMQRVSSLISDPCKNFVQTLRAMISEENQDDDILTVCEKFAKYYLGLSTGNERSDLWIRFLKSTRSIKIDSTYVSVICASVWRGKTIGRGEFLASPEVVGDLKSHNKFMEFITFMRYPLVSYQNFVKMQHIGTAEGLPGRIIVTNPDDAPYLQLDGDDHGTIMYEFESTFDPKSDEAPIIARDVKDRGYDFSRMQLYFKGMIAQKSIGTTFNRMLQCLAMFLDNMKDPMVIYRKFGAALDLFAQGIKKNIVTPSMWELKKERDKLVGGNPKYWKLKQLLGLGRYSKMAIIYLCDHERPWISKLIKQVWDVDMPHSLEKRPILVHRKVSTDIPADLLQRIDRFIERTPEEVGSMSPVVWLKKLIAGIEERTGSFADLRLQIIEGNLVNVNNLFLFLNAYAYVAYKIKKDYASKIRYQEHRLEMMNGLWILASQLTKDLDPDEAVDVIKTIYSSKTTRIPIEPVSRYNDRVNVINKYGSNDTSDGIVISVDRSSALGNPNKMATEADRDDVCDKYELWIREQIDAKNSAVIGMLSMIRNKVLAGQKVYLACGCKPKRCHADTIKRIVENTLPDPNKLPKKEKVEPKKETRKPAPEKTVNIVRYKGKAYLHYKNNEVGKAQLVDETGRKFPGTPMPNKLEVIKSYVTKHHTNGVDYVSTKIGIFSCATGDKIKDLDIKAIFKEA